MASGTVAAGAAREMAQACSQFLESLNPEQKATATYRYEDGERVFWYYPPMNRHGLALRDMDAEQKKLAFAIMAAGLTEHAYKRSTQIIDHELVLGPLEQEAGKITFARDPDLYYFTVFGEPAGDDPWGWRAEGHHLSLHFSIWGDQVISTTPFFFGANPAEVRKGPKTGLQILGSREDVAFELMESMDAAQRSRALLYGTAPYDILTFNATRASLPPEEGLAASRMSGTQRETLISLVTEYVSQVRPELSEKKLASIREQGIDRLHFAWGGPVQRDEAHYYRIHGGNFVVEFDNRQDGANHIHSVWRDVENDFANDVLREHLLLYHVI